jgi:uncharacterized protein (TIGR02996 family)
MARKKNPADGFLDAIVAEPDNDTHRLIYADWLDDQGDADRAAFIRAQCALANLRSGDPEWVEHRVREYELWRANRDAWLAEAPKWTYRRNLKFRRGFPAQIQCGGKEYARHGATLAARSVIDDVFILGPVDEPTRNALTDSPHLPRLTHFGHQFSMPGLLRPWLPRMTALRHLFLPCPLYHHPAVTDDLLSLIRPPHLPALRSLSLIVSPGHALAQALERPGLTELHLERTGLPASELADLLAAPFIADLRRLWLGDDLSAASCRMLGAMPTLAGLRSLRIRFMDQEAAAGLEALLDSPTLANLTSLHLDNIDDNALDRLVRSSRTRRLHSLTLWSWYSRATPDGVRRLLESGALDNLHRLGSVGLPMDVLFGVLANTPALPRLTHLSFLDSTPTPAQLGALAKSPHRGALRAVSTHDGALFDKYPFAVPTAEPIWETW